MARRNLYMPDELAALVEERLPGVNLSEVLQEGVRALLGCRCEHAVCASCASRIDVRARELGALQAFWLDARDALEPAVIRGATAEGALRVLKGVAQRHQVPGADLPLPRPTRAERHAAKVRELEPPVTARAQAS